MNYFKSSCCEPGTVCEYGDSQLWGCPLFRTATRKLSFIFRTATRKLKSSRTAPGHAAAAPAAAPLSSAVSADTPSRPSSPGFRPARKPRKSEFRSSPPTRSEEHTSELQSLRHLVCRL